MCGTGTQSYNWQGIRNVLREHFCVILKRIACNPSIHRQLYKSHRVKLLDSILLAIKVWNASDTGSIFDVGRGGGGDRVDSRKEMDINVEITNFADSTPRHLHHHPDV